MRWILGFCLTFAVLAAATSLSQQRARSAPEILRISPTSGPEGTRVEIAGIDLEGVSAVFLGTVSAQFRAVSSQQLIAIVPHKSTTAAISVLSPAGRAVSPFAFAVMNDPRIPDEVSYKASYVNSAPKPDNFTSARLWGIAIVDTRFPQFRSAQVQVAWTRLSCMVDGHEVVLNDDSNRLRGGLYLREPWFGGHDYHEIMPVTFDLQNQAVVLLVGERADRVWHFWSPSSRASLPPGRLAGCTAKARVKIGLGALLQMGFDYWRSASEPYGGGGNNHEAGASDWFFSSDGWQEAIFSDIGGLRF